MNKKIKGYEVMKLIAENKIEEGQEFILTMKNTITKRRIRWSGKNFIYCDTDTFVLRENAELYFLLGDLEILEDEEEIDIQGLEEPEIKSDGLTEYYEYYNGGVTESGYSKNYSLDDIQARKMIKQLVKAVKQLDKKINKED